jgi:hypothetical protein
MIKIDDKFYLDVKEVAYSTCSIFSGVCLGLKSGKEFKFDYEDNNKNMKLFNTYKKILNLE